ncbi:MAG: DUF2207 domain-containing protein [Cyclobacteriaceae bacterium]|nr:DUF2207 domain-containing protein [Cyclobacteriaceae bacterium]UYN85237.1 MAG: DUF2207 domain-containing protein [Cyclobacteriaceae bacterium]
MPDRFPASCPVMIFLIGLALTVSIVATAQERVLDFKSSLVLQPNHTLDVTETITVHSSGISIKRGIFRTLSINETNLNYQVLGCTRNGSEEPYVIDRNNTSLSIQIGSSDLLKPGEHTYVIRYRVYRKPNSFQPLQWPVTGNWSLAMDHLEAEVIATDGKLSAFNVTLNGQLGCNCSVESKNDNSYRMAVHGGLKPGDDLTLQVNWETDANPTRSWENTERILSFKSLLQVHDDRTLTVTEKINVQSKGVNIIHGIYRELLPQADLGGYEVLTVLRNNQPEHYQVENMGKKFKIRIGHENIFLEPGVHQYLIRYNVEREVHTRLDFHFVYWNVTGNDWKFPIDTVEATIIIPSKGFISFDGYSGKRGSKQCEGCVIGLLNDTTYHVQSVTTLPPGSGLTILTKWKHNLKFSAVITNSMHDYVITLGWIIIIALMVFLLERSRRHVKTEEQKLQPRDINPDDYSPALLTTLASKYIITEHRMKALLSSLFNLSMKGYLEVEEGSSKRRSIVRAKENTEPVYEEDAELFKLLFKEDTSFEFSKRKSHKVQRLLSDFISFMETHYNMEQFIRNNYGKVIGPFLLYLAAILLTVVLHSGAERWILLAPILGSGMFPALAESLRHMFLHERELFHQANWLHIFWIMVCAGLSIGVFILFNYLDMARPVNLVLFAAAPYLLTYYYYTMRVKTSEGMAVLNYIREQGTTAKRLMKQKSFAEDDVNWLKNNLPFLQAYGIKPNMLDKQLGVLDKNLSAAMEEFYRTVRAASTISISASSSSSSGSSGGGGGGGGGGGW